jgi:hypothetical protein
MRTKLTLLLLVLAALCLSTANAASTLKYQYTYTKTTDPKPEVNPAYIPMYDLGILQAGWTIKMTINVPNVAITAILEKSIVGGLVLYY